MRRATAAELASAASPSTSSARKRRGSARVDGEHALDLAVRGLHRNAEVGGEAGVADDRLVGDPRIGREVRDRNGCGACQRLRGDRILGERTADREQLGGLAEHRARHELAALEQAQRARVRGQQVGRLGDDLAQHGARLEVRGQERGDALQLAREGARTMLGLLERGPLEGSDRRLLQALGKREVGIPEGARGVPRHRHHPGPLTGPLGRERDAEQRAGAEPLVLRGVEAGVGGRAAGCDHAALIGGEALERRDRTACPVAGDHRQILAVAHLGAIGLERRRRGAGDGPERVLDGVRRRELGGDERGDAIEPALAAALRERLGILEGERGEPRKRARELDLGQAEGSSVGERRDHERGASAAPPAHRHRELAAHLLERRMADRVRLAARIAAPAAGPRSRLRRRPAPALNCWPCRSSSKP